MLATNVKGAIPMATRRATAEETNAAIHETPGVMGGYPCVGDTRIPVRALVEVLRRYGSVEAVGDYFPQLSRTQVDAGLAYYHAYPARVDEDIETSRRVDAEFAPHAPVR